MDNAVALSLVVAEKKSAQIYVYLLKVASVTDAPFQPVVSS